MLPLWLKNLLQPIQIWISRTGDIIFSTLSDGLNGRGRQWGRTIDIAHWIETHEY